MDFRQRLSTAIAEEREHLEEVSGSFHDFDRGWKALRGGDGDLWKALAEAASVIQADLGWAALCRPSNGGIELAANPEKGQGDPGSDPHFRLHFQPVMDERVVWCETRPQNLLEGESYTLDNLTPDAIRSKVEDFVRSAIRSLRPGSTT